MTIIPLSEGSYTVDATKQFVPFDPGTDRIESRPRGSLLVEIQPFALVTAKEILLMDTGLGFEGKSGFPRIHELLRQAEIEPDQVTRVLVSHLHKDHAGGLGMTDPVTGRRVPSFRNALYYINGKELDYAFAHAGKSYHEEDFGLLAGSDQLIRVESEGLIEGYIHYEQTGGHSPYHQVFLVEEGGTKAFFGGDVAPQMSQMRSRYMANYDYEPRRSMELRQQFAETGRKEGWIFLFYHDTRLPMARMDKA